MAPGRHIVLYSGASEPMACQIRSFKQNRKTWFKADQVEKLGKQGLTCTGIHHPRGPPSSLL